LRNDTISDIVLLGKVEKQRLLQDVKRDDEAEKLYANASDRRDDSLFLEFASAIQKMGINIREQKEFLSSCFLSTGVHTQKKPIEKALLDDVDFAYEMSRRIGSIDIGQSAMVREKMVLAVEAIEGTDAAIRRAGEICQKKPFVVAKSAKAGQDMRFDLPAVGIRTLETMSAAGASTLVIEAASTLVVHPAEFIARADELGLIVIAR